MSNIRLSLVITFLSSNGATVINFILSMVLARLLSPAEIGIFSIASVLVAIAQLFRDFGVGSYLLREKNLTPEKVRAASGVLFASSWIAALVLYLLSGVAAQYYERQEVENVVKVLALGFVFIPFGAVTHSLLTREMRAKEQAIANIVGIAVFATSSITFAMLGFSYMTMAWANLCNIIATALALMPYRPKYAPWIPSFRGWNHVVSFGAGALVSNSIQAVNTTIPDVVLGKLSGPHDVGIYSRAASTTNIFSQIIGPTFSYAVLPFFAQKHHAGESFADPMKKAISYITVTAWPALIATAIFAKEIIGILYGAKWIECVPIVQVLCVTAALSMPFNFNGPAMMAMGRPYQSAIPGVTGILLKLIMIAVIFNGTLMSFAYAMLAAFILNYPVQLWMQVYYFRFSYRAFMESIVKSFVISAILMFSTVLLHWLLVAMPPLLQLSLLPVFILPIWVMMVRITKHPLVSEFEVIAKKFPLSSPFLVGKHTG